MKKEIIIFIVGLLLGAIISTASIYAYTVANKSDEETETQETREMPNGERPEIPNGEMGGGTPPEKPNDTQTNNE